MRSFWSRSRPFSYLSRSCVRDRSISSIFGRTHSTSRSSRTPTLTARTALPPPPTYWSASLVLPVPLSYHLLLSSIFCDRSTDWPGVCRCCLLHILADGFDLLQYRSEFYSCLVLLFSCKWRLSSCTLVLKLLDLVLVVPSVPPLAVILSVAITWSRASPLPWAPLSNLSFRFAPLPDGDFLPASLGWSDDDSPFHALIPQVPPFPQGLRPIVTVRRTVKSDHRGGT